MLQALHFPDAVPTLFGDRLYLRELTEDDVPAWFERASDPESAMLAGDAIAESIEMGIQWLQGHRERFRQQAAIRWAIVPHSSTSSVGTIGLTIAPKKERIAELGIVIGRANWGKGIGTAAVRLVTDYAFGTLGLIEIQAEVLQRNIASQRMLEKAGFRVLRSLPGDPQSDTDFEDCFLLALYSQSAASTNEACSTSHEFL